MEDLVGKKVRGFKFEGDYSSKMDKHIGEVGEIISVSAALKRVRIKFVKHTWNYPADQIEKHLVKEIMEKFKIGDRVQCVESGVASNPRAFGYKPGKEFVINSIQPNQYGNIYFSEDDHGVFEYDLILVKEPVKELPKSFGCTNTNQKLWDKYISWFNTTYSKDIYGGFNSDVYPYYGITTNGVYSYHTSIDFFETILSLEEWDEIVNGTQTKKEKTMKNYTITREQLKKIYDVACGGWKEKITEYAGRNLFGDTIAFTQTEVDEMFKAASLSQTAVLANIFGKQIHEIDLSTGGVDGKDLFSNNGNLTYALMCVRTVGKYANKAFVLNGEYNWELVKDNSNYLCLVPTRKK